MRSLVLRVIPFTTLTLACSESLGPSTEGPLAFAAQVDGNAWTPAIGPNIEAFLTPEGQFLLRAIRHDSFRAVDGIAVIVSRLGGPGRYPFTSDFDADYGLYATYDPDNLTSTSFISTPPNIGALEVTAIDTAAHRIAGRFHFEAQQLDGVRRVRIESGVFRVSYETAFP